jgi:hypothetical protein
VSLSLAQTQALTELANYLYPFLPGKPHPYADQAASFQGVAASLGLSRFWPAGSKLPAIYKLISNTLQFENHNFCPLLVEIVRTAISYRQTKGAPITRPDVDTLNHLIARIGFKIPELHDPKFLATLPAASRNTDHDPATTLTDHSLQQLQTTLLSISCLPPQERGYAFERFLTGLFDAFGLAPRDSFRLTGEQIDGSFLFQGETYLLEATWTNTPVGQEELLAFSGKVAGKAEWSRGLFLAYLGFRETALEAFMRGKATNIVCMDALDLYSILAARLDLNDVLERKVRRAAETNQAFVPVRDLFPNLPPL